MGHEHGLLAVRSATTPSLDERLEDKISAALLGGAIADAMGWVTEFVKSPQQLKAKIKGPVRPEHISEFVSWEKKTGGRFNPYVDYVGAGEYSDDTQLTLCVARAIRPDGTVDNEYFSKVELPAWLIYARGAGATITAAARSMERTQASWNNNFFTFKRGTGSYDYRSSGANGAAMRVGPIAMANLYDLSQLQREVWRNAIVTHGHPKAVVGALVYARALAYVISEPSPNLDSFLSLIEQFIKGIQFPHGDSELAVWLKRWGTTEHGMSFEHILDSAKDEMLAALHVARPDSTTPLRQVYERLGCFKPATKGSAVATVGAALATFLRYGKNFERTVLETVNMLGADTDTIGAMVGSLAAAHAGYSGIPERWATKMQDFSYFLRTATTLTRIAERKAMGPELRYEFQVGPPLRDVMTLPEASDLSEGQRVQHNVFGLGTVKNFHIQPFLSRRGGSMLFVIVQFDFGQTCKFKFFRSDVGRVKARQRSK